MLNESWFPDHSNTDRSVVNFIRRERRFNPPDGLKIKKSSDILPIVGDFPIDEPLPGETLGTLDKAIPLSMMPQSARRHA